MNAERKRVNELLREHTMKAVDVILLGKRQKIREEINEIREKIDRELAAKLAHEARDEYALMADADREAREIETDPHR